MKFIVAGYNLTWIEQSELVKECFNTKARLPYELTIEDIKYAIETLYSLLCDINTVLVNKMGMRLEELMRPNSFPDLLSEILVKSIATHSKTLARNRKHDGFPDLIPIGMYPNDYIHRGKGIEVKASKQNGGWQGHNPEGGWLMVFRYAIDRETKPKEERKPTEIVEVLAAELTLEDWTFSGRGGESRRTITASVNSKGVEKMRSNIIYRSERAL